MPKITVEELTFQRLQRHAKALVDTTDDVINRALDALESSGASGGGRSFATRDVNPHELLELDLTHAKVLDARLNGKSVDRMNWSFLLGRILICAMRRFGDFENLRKFFRMNIVNGFKKDKGYRYIEEINISFQAMSANDTCAVIVNVAQSLEIEFEIVFMLQTGEEFRLYLP